MGRVTDEFQAQIAAWREANPSGRLTAPKLKKIIDPACSEADLRGADLNGAKLLGVNLRSADLRYANLLGADLNGAKLLGVNLRGVNLRGADLHGVDLCIFQLRGLPSGEVICWPTPSGWQLRIDRWTGDVEALDALINGDGDWPETQEEEKDKRRPGMQALIAMLRAHQEYHGDYVPSLQQQWGAGKTENPS